MPTTQVDFSVAAYNDGGWNTALSEDYYDRLGQQPDGRFTVANMQSAYEARYQWWLKREEQFKSGHQMAIALQVGPHTARAKRNLDQAKTALSDPQLRTQYDHERARSRLAGWQQHDLRNAVAGLSGRISADMIKTLVSLGVAQGLPGDQVTSAVEAELLRAGFTLPTESGIDARPAKPSAGEAPSGPAVSRPFGRLFSRGANHNTADPSVREFFERKQLEKQKAEDESRRLEQIAQRIKQFAREENQRIWNFVRHFDGKWVADTQFTKQSRIRLTTAEDGGVLIGMAGLDIQISCHQNHDQWWYYLRFRGNSPGAGDWSEPDQHLETLDQVKSAFMNFLDRVIDVGRMT